MTTSTISTTNEYVQLLLTDKAGLESKISNLVEEQLNSNDEAEGELDLIAKVIDYSFTIKDTCYFLIDCPSLNGEKAFSSVEAYKEKDDFYTAEAAENDGVEWDGGMGINPYGSFSWDNCPEVSVEVEGLTEDAGEEAKTLWDALRTEQQHQEQLDWKRQRLERAQRELLELQAELAAAETNA
jgi:hypothetical protein